MLRFVTTRFVPAFLVAVALFGSLPARAANVGETAPCVMLDHINSPVFTGEHCIREAREGRSFTLIEFFSIACKACQVNLPKVASLGLELADTTELRFVSIDRDRTAVEKYVAGNPSFGEFPVALDVERFARRAYEVVATPTIFLLDSESKILFTHAGVLSDADIESIRSIVKASAKE